MINKILSKIRSIIQGSSKSTYESFTATSSKTFPVAQDNVEEITQITVNGTAITESDYSYDENSQTVTINAGKVSSGDVVIIYFDYTRYSDTELIDYIESALIYMDSYSYPIHFDIGSGDTEIFPIPKQKEQNLISMIASIIIQPDFSEYRTSSVVVRYPRQLDKENRIERLIAHFKMSREGISGVIDMLGSDF